MNTSFSEKVYAALQKIPKGRITTYAEIAKAIGKPNAFRAVGNACNQNPNALKVPCHRVVKSDGTLGGYAFGTNAKIRRLRTEGIEIKNNKIVEFKKFIVTAKELEKYATSSSTSAS